MNKLLKYLITANSLLFAGQILAQDRCKPESVYTTDSVGNSTFKIPQKLFHKISDDSVRIFLGDEVSIPMIDFQIKKKDCYKDADSVSYTIELALHSEKSGKVLEPTLKVRCNYMGAYQIELLYPNKEERIFYIDQQKSFFKKD